jgi:hypothetical protein
MDNRPRWAKCELSSINTSLLLCGILTARAYFQDAEIQELATKIYNRVEWPWMLNGGPTFSMGWMPDSGFLGKVRRPKIRCRDEKNERTETSVKEKLPTSWGEWRLVGSFLWA